MTAPFPHRLWVYPRGQWSGWLPTRGGDEWGRHTVAIPTPFGTLVIAHKTCPQSGACEEMAEFACSWPGCPFTGLTPGGTCPTHDPEWDVDEDEVAA